MKVLFAGPSLHGLDPISACASGRRRVDRRGPAAQGDIARAVVEGATIIGLVDGLYEDRAAPWHKEILFALEQGVQVFGAASLGALRAAECAAFGMVGMGVVFKRYHSGDLADDAAVAQLHAPAELGYLPLTEALANVEATIGHFRETGAIGEVEAEQLDRSARALFFKERTYARILAHARLDTDNRGEELKALIKSSRVDVKRQDALALLSHIESLEPERSAPPEWRLEQTGTWQLTLQRAQNAVAAAGSDGRESDGSIAA